MSGCQIFLFDVWISKHICEITRSQHCFFYPPPGLVQGLTVTVTWFSSKHLLNVTREIDGEVDDAFAVFPLLPLLCDEGCCGMRMQLFLESEHKIELRKQHAQADFAQYSFYQAYPKSFKNNYIKKKSNHIFYETKYLQLCNRSAIQQFLRAT